MQVMCNERGTKAHGMVRSNYGLPMLLLVVARCRARESPVCDEPSRALLAWHARLSNASSNTCVRVADPRACARDTAAGCCAASARGAPFPAAAAGGVLVSLAATESAAHVVALAANALNFTAGALVAHVDCGCRRGWCTAAGRDALSAALPPRARLNPDCVPTRTGEGSLLHAHLRNFAFAARAGAAPSHVVFMSSDLEWFAPFDAFVRRHGSSANVLADAALLKAAGEHWGHGLPLLPLAHPPGAKPFSARDADGDWLALLGAEARNGHLNLAVAKAYAARGLEPPGLVSLRCKHEGAFFPASLVARLLALLEDRGPLGRLNLRTCRAHRRGPGGADVQCGRLPCVEETYAMALAPALLSAADLDALVARAAERPPLCGDGGAAAPRPCDLERGTLSEWEANLPNRGTTKFAVKRRAYGDHAPRGGGDW